MHAGAALDNELDDGQINAVRADVKEVISGFSSVFVFLWAVLTLLLLFLIYQVATFGYGLAFPAVDPLAF